jgi:hypothetical protein
VLFPQRLRVEAVDYPERIRKRFGRSLAGWKEMRAGLREDDSKRIEAVQEIIQVYERELRHFENVRDQGINPR